MDDTLILIFSLALALVLSLDVAPLTNDDGTINVDLLLTMHTPPINRRKEREQRTAKALCYSSRLPLLLLIRLLLLLFVGVKRGGGGGEREGEG